MPAYRFRRCLTCLQVFSEVTNPDWKQAAANHVATNIGHELTGERWMGA